MTRRWLAALALALVGASAHAATVALVIDDLGYSTERARRALALPPPVTVAILPHTPHAERIARAAGHAQIDVLVHLPMEAHSHAPQPGMLRANMPTERFRARVRRALAGVPGAIGVNNHMGSRLTGNAEPMALLMDELLGSGLVFIDSRTTARSRAADAARAAGVASTERDVFLDHDQDPAAIERQVERWLELARTSGCALAIAHPRPATFAVLERVLPRAQGIDRVGIRTYIERCGKPGMSESGWQVSLSSAPGAEAEDSAQPTPESR